jgi:hypothetical protein
MDRTKVEYNNLQPGGKRSLRQTSCRLLKSASKIKDERMWVGIMGHRVGFIGGLL